MLMVNRIVKKNTVRRRIVVVELPRIHTPNIGEQKAERNKQTNR